MKRTPCPTIRPQLEPLEDRMLLSAAVDLQMTGATTTDSKTLSVNYTISGASLAGQTLDFNVYRSAGFNSLAGAQLIGTMAIAGSDSADLGIGQHQGVRLSLTGTNGQPLPALTPNAALPFLVVVANPNGSIAEDAASNNVASFETHVLGVIVHGLDFSPLDSTTPQWETVMAQALQTLDGYQAVIPFNWVQLSALPIPGVTSLAALQLEWEVIVVSDLLATQHPGDVVDINFIGHSRGNVVVSQTLQDLVGTTNPALQGGFMQMTMLDPHPVNNLYGPFSAKPGFFGDVAAEVVSLFQSLANDPQVVVPPNVSQAQLFDQQSPAGQNFLAPEEMVLNLWGEMQSALPNESGQPIESVNLTNVDIPGIGPVGHSESHLWYLLNVVANNDTFTNFG